MDLDKSLRVRTANAAFCGIERIRQMATTELSYCIVNTSQRELLLRGLDAIAHEREALPFVSEVLVLDNGSRDGSVEAAREHRVGAEVIALERRQGKGENDSELLRRAGGRYALLLNEDTELRPGASLALWQTLEERPRFARARARLLRPDGAAPASAWRFPSRRCAMAARRKPSCTALSHRAGVSRTSSS